MIAYAGSKRKQLPLIESLLPAEMPIDIFDPFGGAGSVSMFLAEKFPHSVVHFNDKKAALPGLMDALRDEVKTDELCAALQATHIETRADRLPYVASIETDAAAFLIATFTGFRSQADSKTPITRDGKIPQPASKIPAVRAVSAKLRALQNIRTSNVDGLEIIKENAEKDCFIYLDPPYAGTRHLYGGFSPSSIFSIAEIMRAPTTRSKIMIQLDFTGGTYAMFSSADGKQTDLIKWWGPVKYSFSNSGDRYMKLYNDYQLIATNY